MSVILALGRLGQEDQESKGSQGYIVKLLSQTKQNKLKTKQKGLEI
jgi:hypothetical protein